MFFCYFQRITQKIKSLEQIKQIDLKTINAISFSDIAYGMNKPVCLSALTPFNLQKELSSLANKIYD